MNNAQARSHAAALLGSLGGKKRAQNLTPERRQEIARMGTEAAKRARQAKIRDAGREAGTKLADQSLKDLKKPKLGTVDRKVYDALADAGCKTGPQVQDWAKLSDLQVRSAFSTLRRNGYIERAGELDGRAAYRVKV